MFQISKKENYISLAIVCFRNVNIRPDDDSLFRPKHVVVLELL